MSCTKDHVIDTITTWDDAIDGLLPAWLRRDPPTPCLPTTVARPAVPPTTPAIHAHHQRALSPPAGGDGGTAMR
jgi:hypothetical protein